MKVYIVRMTGRGTEMERKLVENNPYAIEFEQGDGRIISIGSLDSPLLRLRTPEGLLILKPEASNTVEVQCVGWDTMRDVLAEQERKIMRMRGKRRGKTV